MAERLSTDDQSVASVDELAVGDAIYSEASDSSYWVVWMTGDEVLLEDRNGSPRKWRRETFEASLDAHTWIRQSRRPGKEN